MSLGDRLMNMQVRFKPGAVVPLHAHQNEQISYMAEGHLRFTIGNEELLLGPGESVIIPANVPHSVIAEDEALAIDTFHPPRADLLAQVRDLYPQKDDHESEADVHAAPEPT